MKLIIDGHNRYKICQENSIDKFKVTKLKFDNRYEVINWIIKHQLGSRNLIPEQKQYLIHKMYENEKKSVSNPKGKINILRMKVKVSAN